MRRVVLASLLLTGCALHAPGAPPECMVDSDCRAGKVCFVDGCGDPGMNLVVEVTGDTSGLHPQDFRVDSLGGAMPVMNLDVRGPLTLSGKLQQDAEDQSGPIDYTGGVTIIANGESDLIPGLNRRYSLVLPRADQAAYQMFIGAGTYTVTARSSEAAIPYQTRKVTAAAGLLSAASFKFPAFNQLLVFTGRLVKSTRPLVTYQAGMTIQAFESIGGAPLSQVTQVSSVGDFTMHIADAAALLTSITLVAVPKDNTVLVPTKTFVISPVPVAQSALGTLELGDFGDQLPGASATLLDDSEKPIANASVVLEGKVNGEGVFTSRTVVTDAMGVFTVDLLPSADDATYTLTATPPPESAAGVLQTQVRAGLNIDGKPALFTGSPPEPKLTFVCPARLTVTGTVLRPTGDAAFQVQVIATAIEAIDMHPVPARPTTVSTGTDGTYRLLLDQAKYRLDFVPADLLLPRKSRVVRVEPSISADAGTSTSMDLGEFQLSVGRTVTGLITVRPNTEDRPDAGSAYVQGTPAPNALVRFYRVTPVEGVDSSLLVGEAITDDRGFYQLALPDHPAKTASGP